MSTIKSSAEDLTLNADGSGNDVIIQSNGSTKAIVNAEGNVGIGVTPETWDSSYNALQIGGNGAVAATASQAAGGKTLLGQNVYVDSGSGVYEYISTDEASLLYQQNGAFKFRVAASGSADAAITWTDAFEVLNAGQARAKNGLLFGTDTAAANTLDDYEEGTWTPVYTGTGGSAGSVAMSEQVGNYTKIGRLVTCHMQVTLTNAGSWSSSVKFTGLPFTNGESYGHPGVGALQTHQVNYVADTLMAAMTVDGGAATATIGYTLDNGNSADLSTGGVAAAAAFRASFSYWV